MLQEEVNVTTSLKEATSIHDLPSVLTVCVTQLESFLNDANERYKVTSDSIEEKTFQVDEHRKSILQEIESNLKALKTLQEEVANLKWAISDFLERTMRDKLGIRQRIIKHTRKLCPNVVISAKAVDLLKPVPGVALGGASSTSILDALT